MSEFLFLAGRMLPMPVVAADGAEADAIFKATFGTIGPVVRFDMADAKWSDTAAVPGSAPVTVDEPWIVGSNFKNYPGVPAGTVLPAIGTAPRRPRPAKPAPLGTNMTAEERAAERERLEVMLSPLRALGVDSDGLEVQLPAHAVEAVAQLEALLADLAAFEPPVVAERD